MGWDRILFFSFCLVGNTLFFAYQASLTSELIVKPAYKLPFSSMEELLDSNYVLSIQKDGGLTEQSFQFAEKGTSYDKAFEKYSREDFILEHDTGIQMLLEGSVTRFRISVTRSRRICKESGHSV